MIFNSQGKKISSALVYRLKNPWSKGISSSLKKLEHKL